jgi:thioredoxin reductase/Pyruvate/2-oxoacid:ferredoxin oxidoreductase delta subunit
MDSGLLIVSGAFAAAALAGFIHLARRTMRGRHDAKVLAEKIARNQNVPRSLHPVVDTDVCIGSLSCLKACPEGDILGIVDHAARLVHGDHCIGHGRCAVECPVGAIKLVFGTSERGLDLPEVNEVFESSRPGVHLVGELGGMGLIKNALTQGLQVAEHLGESLPKGRQVVVVGAGPAGLATALGLRARGIPHLVLEQDTVGGSVAHYPRRKVAMTETVDLPIVGRFGKKTISKEELLAGWAKVIDKAGLRVEQGVKVEGIQGEDGSFQVVTNRGTVGAAKVVLATGRRGTPRKLGVKGEELEKVFYGLKDPDQFNDAKVLVVGGGDAALEAAIQLASESSAAVAISYRNAEFARCREANRSRIAELVSQRKVAAIMRSEVQAIAPRDVLIEVEGHPEQLPNDFVIINAGGELPTEFLKKAGIKMHLYRGKARGEETTITSLDLAKRKRRHAGTSEDKRLLRRLRWLRRLYLLVGLAILGYLAWRGLDYYPLSRVERLRSPLHKVLRAAGPWGIKVGIAATLFMLSNFLYALRKRGRLLKGWGDIRGWLDFHVFVGFMSPLVVAFHAAFQANNALATSTAGALLVVMFTGVIGRYIFGLVPAQGGRAQELEDISANFERLRAYAAPALAHVGPKAQALLDRATAPIRTGSFLALFLRFPFEAAALRFRLRWLRRSFPDPEVCLDLRRALVKLARLRWQLRFYGSLKALLRGWRVFHATMAIFLVLALTAHIAVSLYLGYGPR